MKEENAYLLGLKFKQSNNNNNAIECFEAATKQKNN